MSNVRSSVARVALFALLAVSVGSARGDVALKWSGKPGETFKYAFSQVQELKYTIDGLPRSSRSELSVDMTWVVKSVATDGAIEVSIVADRVRVKTTSDGRIIAYDSGDKDAAATPEAEVFRKAYDAMIGKAYVLKISAQGEVVDVKVPDAVIAAIGGTPFAANADSGSFHSPTGVKNMFAQIMPKLPKAPVASGANWKSSLTLPAGPSKIELQNTYTITSDAPVATFSAKIDTTITSPVDAPITLKMNKQSGTGKFTFDTRAGHLADAAIHQSFDMTLKDAQKEVPQTIELDLSLKLIK